MNHFGHFENPYDSQKQYYRKYYCNICDFDHYENIYTTNTQQEAADYAYNTLVARVLNVERKSGGWSYISYRITNNTEKLGWASIRIFFTDTFGKQQQVTPPPAYMHPKNHHESWFGVKNYEGDVDIQAWFQ